MRVWSAIATGLEQRGAAALVTVLAARGSAPREAGARMVVFADGTFTGTIGGGTLEWRAIAVAQGMMAAQAAPPPLLPLGEKVAEGRMRGPEAQSAAPARQVSTTTVKRRGTLDRTRPLARRLRSDQTDAEGVLWSHLRGRRFVGVKFRRQAPIGRYVADFHCPAARLIIEADGGQHNESIRDTVRDAWLAREGYRVLRFWNDEILKQTDMVLDVIWAALDEAGALRDACPDPSSALRAPSPPGGEGEAAPSSGDFRLLSYALGPELGQCCGGHVEVAVEVFRSERLPEVRDLATREAAGRFGTVGRVTAEGVVRTVVAAGEAPVARLEDGVLTESFGEDARTLLLFGAGHVGRALVLALAPLPFRVLWIDPRPDAFPKAVPGNVTLIRPADPVACLAEAPAGSFVLVMTHSHALDLAIADAALAARHARPGAARHGTVDGQDEGPRFSYLGVIGSATKRARFETRLAAMGHGSDAIARMVCPIGAAGPTSKLPAVIAAATAVELIVRAEALRAAAAETVRPVGKTRLRLASGGRQAG